MVAKIGVVHGRFQPLHKGHLLEYILPAKKLCDILYIGITNSDTSALVHTDAAPHRSDMQNNPFTYREREIMIRETLLESGLHRNEFVIVPFPIHKPDLICSYVPNDSTFYMTIFDKWGEEKLELLKKEGLHVEVITHTSVEHKSMCATDIRNLIRQGLPWEQFVPKAIYKFIQTHSI